MTFLVPLGLIGLLALPAVVILHLVRQRRRRMRVPSLELWRSMPAAVQHKPRRLPLTLLLLLHLLAVALLALALGRPLLEGGAFQPASTIVVLDTSTSMATVDAGLSGTTPRFVEAKTAAQQIFRAARKGDQIGLVVLGSPPRLTGSGGPEAAPALSTSLEDMKPGGPDGDLGAALNLAEAAAKPADGRALQTHYVVLTDRAFGGRTGASAPLTVTGDLQWRTFGDGADNVAIVAFAARPSRQAGQQLYARVANLGTQPVARTLQLSLDGTVVQREPMRLQAGAEAEWSWPLPAGAHLAAAKLTTSDLAPIDDGAAVVLSGGAMRRVQMISSGPTPLERALRAQPGIDLALATPADYHPDPSADLVIFSGFIPKILPGTPTLIVAPPQTNDLLKISSIKRDLRPDIASDQRFAAIDLTSVRVARAAVVEPPAWSAVLLAAGDTPLILGGILDGQPRMIWTFDPADSNLQGRLAFPLLTAATLSTLLQPAGDDLRIGEPAPGAMVAPAGERVPAGTRLTTPGVYHLADRTGTVAVNALDAAESDLRPRERPAIVEDSAAIATVEREAGHELWRELLAAALVVLMLEWLYLQRRDRRRRPIARSAPGMRRPA